MFLRMKVIGSICLIAMIMGTVYKFKYSEKAANETLVEYDNELDKLNGKISEAKSSPTIRQQRMPASESVNKTSHKTIPFISKIDKNKFSRVTENELKNSTTFYENNSRGEGPEDSQEQSPSNNSNYVSTPSFNSPMPIPFDDSDENDVPLLLKKSNSSNKTDGEAEQKGFAGNNQNTASNKNIIKPSFSTSGKKNSPTNTSVTPDVVRLPDVLKCTANIDSGYFGHPIGVLIECNYPHSDIKYCLALDNCCDPDSQGRDYISKVIVGPKNGNYCLSYKGSSDTGGTSDIFQTNYTINSQLPDIQTGFEKLFYQTTELIGENLITSLDFGKPNYSIGQINFKARDPGPAGANYNCDEMVVNAPGLNSPAVMNILALFGVDSLSPTSQVNIPLALDKMDYGENFVASYIVNNSYAAPLYACSVSKITLDDFEFFQTDIAQSEPGTNDIRLFEGQFTEYGFFESQITDEPTRAPAGESSEVSSGQKLKTGLLGIFY